MGGGRDRVWAASRLAAFHHLAGLVRVPAVSDHKVARQARMIDYPRRP